MSMARLRNFGHMVALSLPLMLLAVTATASAGTLDDVKARGELIVGVKTDYPPFGYVDASGKNIGFDVDLAHAFAKALFGNSDKVVFVSVTSGNRIPFLLSRKIDIIVASVTMTPERAQVVDFSKPYFYSGSLLLVRANSHITGLDDLAGKSVAIIQGSASDDFIAQLAPKASRIKYANASDAVLALKIGRVDAYTHDDTIILTVAKENPDLKVVGKAFNPLPFGIAVRKDDPQFSAWVNQQLDTMHSDGTFDALWQSYFGALAANLIKP